MPQLTTRTGDGYNASMAGEIKTEKVVLRVKPSFRKDADTVAGALDTSVTRIFEEAFRLYCERDEVKQALAEAGKSLEWKGR